MAAISPPSAFRKWQYTSVKGGLEKNLKLNSSAPMPTPNANQHLVRMIAVALNPVDYKIAEVPFAGHFITGSPATPGIDFAGTIITPATGSSLRPGQLVFGTASSSPAAGGGLSEFALTEKTGTVAIPDGVDPVDAATIGVAGLSAYQPIVPRVKKGDKIFINGGSGGTGVFGIQIAKAIGCYVTTSCSTVNVELCKKLGADEVIDYKKESVVEALRASGTKFDLIVDNVGGDVDLYWKCHEFTKPGAVYAMVAGGPSFKFISDTVKRKFWPGILGGGKRKLAGFFAQPKNDELAEIVDWMKEGKVRAVIDQRFPFEQAAQAFEKLKTGRAKGKIVIDIISQTSAGM